MTHAPDTPARGDAGPHVSDTCLSSWINRAEADYPSRRWDEDFVEVMLDLRDARATIAALRRQVEELQGKLKMRDACLHQDNLTIKDLEIDIADLERRLADAERGGMERAAEIAKALPLVTTRDNPDIFARNEPYCKHVTTASDAADAIRAAIPAPQEGKPE